MLFDKADKDSDKIVKSKIFEFPDGATLNKFLAALNPITAVSEIIASNLSLSNFGSDLIKMENAVSNLAGKFGGARTFAVELKKTIEEATPSVIALGGTIDDVISLQEGVMKGLNRQVNLDKTAFADLYAIGGLINDGTEATSESTAKLVGEFKDAGYGLYQVSKQMGDVVKDAREIGVASAAVYEQLSKNIKSLNLYNFEDGVRGMGKMAAEAASMRLDMGSTLKLAENLFNPEDAIKMAADMQRLGVQVTNLLDPYKLMDMARNKPEELQESIYKAASALTYFDEKNQKISILPGQQGTLRELAKSFGMTADEFAKIAVNYGDMERKMKSIKFNPIVTEEGDRKFLAGLSELQNGKYMVNMGLDPKTHEAIMKPIEALDKKDIERLRKAEGDKKKSPSELIVEANNNLVNIQRSIEAQKGIVGRKLASSEQVENLQQKTYSIYEPAVRGAGETYGVKYEEKGGYIDASDISTKLNTSLDVMSNAIEKAANESGIDVALKDIGTGLAKAAATIFTTNGSLLENITNKSKEMKESGQVTQSYDFSSMGMGGEILTKATTAVAAGLKEALRTFENPGTLKVTIYGEKIGLIPLIAERMKLKLPDEYVKNKEEEKKSEEEKNANKKSETVNEQKINILTTPPAPATTVNNIGGPKEKTIVDDNKKKDLVLPEVKKGTQTPKTTSSPPKQQYLMDIVQSTKDKNDNLYNWKEVRAAWQEEHKDKKEGTKEQNLDLLKAWKEGWKPKNTEKPQTTAPVGSQVKPTTEAATGEKLNLKPIEKKDFLKNLGGNLFGNQIKPTTEVATGEKLNLTTIPKEDFFKNLGGNLFGSQIKPTTEVATGEKLNLKPIEKKDFFKNLRGDLPAASPTVSNLTMDLKTLLPKPIEFNKEPPTDRGDVSGGLTNVMDYLNKENDKKSPLLTKMVESTVLPQKINNFSDSSSYSLKTPGIVSDKKIPEIPKSITDTTKKSEMPYFDKISSTFDKSIERFKTVTNTEFNETKLKTISDSITRTPVISNLPSSNATLPRGLTREESPTMERKGATDKLEVSVVVKGEFPNDLQPIWNQALRNTQWMENLQRTISASIVEKNAIRGTGRYSKPFLT